MQHFIIIPPSECADYWAKCNIRNAPRCFNGGFPPKLWAYIEEYTRLCRPKNIYICNGSLKEYHWLLNKMKINDSTGTDNLPWMNPAVSAHVEQRTTITTDNMSETIQIPIASVTGGFGDWIAPNDMDQVIREHFTGCMIGRRMYVIAFSIGTMSLSKIGIAITDSPYVVCSMRRILRTGLSLWEILATHANMEFKKVLHSVRVPKQDSRIEVDANCLCDPERRIIFHTPTRREEFGTADYMLILGVRNRSGNRSDTAAPLPRAGDNTNRPMIQSSPPRYQIGCVSDDIPSMRDDSTGNLGAVNPQNVTSSSTNPIMVEDRAGTSMGGTHSERMVNEIVPNEQIGVSRRDQRSRGSTIQPVHPNSSSNSPAGRQSPMMVPERKDAAGAVPANQRSFAGRRMSTIRNYLLNLRIIDLVEAFYILNSTLSNTIARVYIRFFGPANVPPIQPTELEQRQYDPRHRNPRDSSPEDDH